MEAHSCIWPWVEYCFFSFKDHPCNTNQAHLGFVKRCLGLVFRLALIPHLTHLQLKSPSLSLHVLPSVRSLRPDHTQLSALLLSLLFQLPSDGASEGRARTGRKISVLWWALFLWAILNDMHQFYWRSFNGEQPRGKLLHNPVNLCCCCTNYWSEEKDQKRL